MTDSIELLVLKIITLAFEFGKFDTYIKYKHIQIHAHICKYVSL